MNLYPLLNDIQPGKTKRQQQSAHKILVFRGKAKDMRGKEGKALKGKGMEERIEKEGRKNGEERQEMDVWEIKVNER